ncbi:MAG: hypothetical protein K5650_05725 [Bacteroidales bacterium]|nr:hypothetical protein [Bacteroidales bacterium]
MRTALLILTAAVVVALQAPAQELSVAWWNVENYCDPTDDPHKADNDFTPEGSYHWNRYKMLAKRDSIYKVIAAMDCPDLVGLAEVEGEEPLRELCLGTPLRHAGYAYLLSPSSDRRGIACALIYRTGRFEPDTSYAIEGSGSRNIFVATGRTATGDTLVLLLNHWPSRRHSDSTRMASASALRMAMAELRRWHPSALIMAMGDLNCEASEEALNQTMGFADGSRNAEGTELLTLRLPPSQNSYYYHGYWSNIDHMMLSQPADSVWQVAAYEVFAPEFMLTEVNTRLGVQPMRTYYGRQYRGGFSDHLPLILRLLRH